MHSEILPASPLLLCCTAPGTVFGLVTILGITPLLGFALRLIPLQPVELIIGLVVVAVVPTSLGVGIALATMAKVRSSTTRVIMHIACSLIQRSRLLTHTYSNNAKWMCSCAI